MSKPPLYNLSELIQTLGIEQSIASNPEIHGLSLAKNPVPDTLCIAIERKHLQVLKDSKFKPTAVFTKVPTESFSCPVIISNNPENDYAKLLSLFDPRNTYVSDKSIHSTVIIGDSSELGSEIKIGPWSEIGDDCVIGDNVSIGSRCKLGNGLKIASGTTIANGVTLDDFTIIGEQVKIGPGCVIGGIGFGFYQDGQKQYHNYPQIGNVILQDKVELGANCTIDRATIGQTEIGEGTKIDNLVHIGHNVAIGKHCVIAAQVGIAGSVSIGDFCILAGQVGIADHVSIANNTIIGAQSGVNRSVTKTGTYIFGYPAGQMPQMGRIVQSWNRLPEMVKDWKKIKKELNLD